MSSLTCPRCKKATRPGTSMRRTSTFRNWQGDETLPTAVRHDGTCSRCNEQVKHVNNRFGGDYQPTEEEIVERGRQEVAAYFADRRSRGVNPEGNRDLDKMFENDVKTGAWLLPRLVARHGNRAQRAALGLGPRK